MATRSPAASRPLDWVTISWFVFTSVGAVAGAVYLPHVSLYTLLCAFVLCAGRALSVTAGAHRLYSHSTYKAHPALELLIALFFSTTFQGVALWWIAMHIRHHAFSDTSRDPYSIRHGYGWAHIGWMCRRSETLDYKKEIPLLARNTILRFQERYGFVIGILFGFVLPTYLCSLWGDWQGGLLVVGFLSLVIQYHLTWMINSYAHWYMELDMETLPALVRCSLRSFNWVYAWCSGGEAHHQYHHEADTDYRIGPHWWQPDPGKWAIQAMCFIGLGKDPITVSPSETIRRKAFIRNARAV